VTDHLRENGGPAGPGLDGLPRAGGIHLFDLLEELDVDKGAFLYRA
jgi:hypothetical protein